MFPTICHKYKYFHSTVQRAEDRQQEFHFCCLPFNVRPHNVNLNLSIICNETVAYLTYLASKFLNPSFTLNCALKCASDLKTI